MRTTLRIPIPKSAMHHDKPEPPPPRCTWCGSVKVAHLDWRGAMRVSCVRGCGS